MRGTFDLLILRSIATMPLHGLGIARRIGQITQGASTSRPSHLRAGESETRRRAKFYRLTRLGKKHLHLEEANWRRVALAMAQALGST